LRCCDCRAAFEDFEAHPSSRAMCENFQLRGRRRRSSLSKIASERPPPRIRSRLPPAGTQLRSQTREEQTRHQPRHLIAPARNSFEASAPCSARPSLTPGRRLSRAPPTQEAKSATSRLEILKKGPFAPRASRQARPAHATALLGAPAAFTQRPGAFPLRGFFAPS